MALPEHRIRSFAEFWPYYVAEHLCMGCRLLHYSGALLAAGTLAAAVALQHWWLLLVVPIAGYGPAWLGHFCVERNKPATWSYLRWSLMGEYKMLWLGLTGRMGREVAQATARQTDPDRASTQPSEPPLQTAP